MKTATERYITLKTFPHYGCIAIPTGKVEEGKAEIIMVKCTHNTHKMWITREDI